MENIEFNIEQMLQSERAWEFVLLDIVHSEDLDPWDIDLTKLTQKYMDRVNSMKKLDLRVPARLILAASILLRMQSDQLVMAEEGEDFADTDFTDDDLFDQPADEKDVIETVPDLNIQPRRKHIRKITLGDLIDKLKKSMQPKLPRTRNTLFRLDLPEVDISQQIETLYGTIVNHALKKIPFSTLTEKKGRLGVIDTFLPLLHLANDNKVDLDQDEFFQELYVKHIPEEEQKKLVELIKGKEKK